MEVNSVAVGRLQEERKLWRKDHPHGFFARPSHSCEGGTNLMKWTCGIPGKPNTPWEGSVYKLMIEFGSEYPSKPPVCKFTPPLFHPNIYPSGTVCLSILDEEEGWLPSFTIKEILIGIQTLLNTPNPYSPAQDEPCKLYKFNRREYYRRVRMQAALSRLS